MNKTTVRTILTVVSVGGVLATAFFAAKGGKKADEKLEQAGVKYVDIVDTHVERRDKDPKFLDKVKICWKSYIPTAISVGVTTGCIVASHKISTQQIAIATAFGVSAQQLCSRYEDKIKKVLGKEEAQEIKKEIVNDMTKDSGRKIEKLNKLRNPEEGNVLFYDMYSDQFFYSSMENVLEAEIQVNKQFARIGQVTINDWLVFIGQEKSMCAEDVGWSMELGDYMEYAWIDFTHWKDNVQDEKRGIDYDFYVIQMETPPCYISEDWREYIQSCNDLDMLMESKQEDIQMDVSMSSQYIPKLQGKGVN